MGFHKHKDIIYNPHLRHIKMEEINCRLIVSNERTRDQILGSLNQNLRERYAKAQESKKESRFLPHYLIIVDEPKWIIDHSVMEYLQKDTFDLGFSIIYCSAMDSSLPENIGSVLKLEEDNNATLLLNEKKEVNSIITLPDTQVWNNMLCRIRRIKSSPDPFYLIW